MSDSGSAGGDEVVDERVDRLYDLPPGEFTAARNVLARELRGEGRREHADRVAKLRKPTVAAWAINQAVRRHRDRVDALLETGEQVGRAQRRALSGVRGSGMREAARARREAIDELTDLAAGILAEAGSNPESHRGDIAATFDAASADDGASSTVRAARLASPLPVSSDFTGLEGLLVLPEPEEAPDETGEAEEHGAGERQRTGGRAAADDAERERVAQHRREAIRALEEARRTLADAEAEARTAAGEVSARVAEAEAADRAAEEAKEAWRRLQREAAELHEEVGRARNRADATRRQVEHDDAQVRQRERDLNDVGA